MELARKIIEREIAQRMLANKSVPNNLNKDEINLEIKSLDKALNTLDMFNIDNLNSLYNTLEHIIKKGNVNICPSCNNPTTIVSNPYYYHECDICGWNGSYLDCTIKTPKDFFIEILTNNFIYNEEV